MFSKNYNKRLKKYLKIEKFLDIFILLSLGQLP